MATDTEHAQEAHSSALQPPPDATALASAPLHQRIGQFRNGAYRVLLAAIRDPDGDSSDYAAKAGVQQATVYQWMSRIPGFKEMLAEIRSHAGDLRSEYAQAAFREAVPGLADAMVIAGLGTGRDAQRARERVLEATGVLKKENVSEQAPIVVTTHTYVLVQPQPASAGVVVEGEAKELPPPKLGLP